MPAAGLIAVSRQSPNERPSLDIDAGEAEVHLQPGVAIVLGDSVEEEAGTLYITTKRLIWFSSVVPLKGYAVDFLSLTMHAISRDTEAFSCPCIFTQIENGYVEDYHDEDDGSDEEEVGEAEPDLSKVTEMRLVPDDPSVLDRLFQVLSECAALNPDPESAEDGDGSFFFDEQDANSMDTAAMVERWDNLLQQGGGGNNNLMETAAMDGRWDNRSQAYPFMEVQEIPELQDPRRFEDADDDSYSDEDDD